MKHWLLTVILVSAACAVAFRMGRARASGIPQGATLNYSGTLLTFGQADNGTHNLILRLSSGGSVVCTTTVPSPTQFTNGHFTVALDSTCVPAVHQYSDLQVEVVVDGVSMGLTAMGSVPYAVESDTASNAAAGSPLASLVPAGSVMAFAGSATPPGWLACNGQAVNRVQYAGLFAAIGVSSGSGNGTTTFNVPDYRGYFLRGVDTGANRDPDTAGRTAMASGGNTGDAVGSVEPGAFAAHSHGVNDPGHDHGGSTTPVNNAGGATNGARDWGANGGGLKGISYALHVAASGYFNEHTHGIPAGGTGVSIQASGGSETRPANAYVNYLIKY